MLLFEKNEIETAALKHGEDEELEEQYRLVANSKNITEILANACHYVEEGAYDAVDRAARDLNGVAEYGKELASMSDTLATVSDLLSGFARTAREYMDNNTYSEEDFLELENRLNLINHLKAKYGKTIEDVLLYYENLEMEYDKLMNHDLYVAKLKEQMAAIENKLEKSCKELSDNRKKIAKVLTKNITDALVDLNFLDVRFDMVFEQMKNFSADGYDNAYFIISTNIGEEMKPLWQVASGGELSRIMLAMKSCLADADRIETLIFDEIDVGISGRTAQKVSEKMAVIAKKHQVICITHLPQIAAMADTHFIIEKQVSKEKTATHIRSLNREGSVNELARILGGAEITDTVLKSAEEMKKLADQMKVA